MDDSDLENYLLNPPTPLSQSEFESKLLKDGQGIKLVGIFTELNKETEFECSNGHQWLTKASYVAISGCPRCKRVDRLLKSDIESWLLEDGRGIKLVGDYVNSRTKTTFECTHGHQWDAVPNSIKSGSGCSVCSPSGFNPNKPAWTYIFTRGSYLKYGITGNLNSRMTQHRRHGELELVYTKHHENGQDALDWENQIKQTHGGKYVTDALCPDGHTETLPMTHLQLLLEEKFIDKIHST